jgi:hypothetical protein
LMERIARAIPATPVPLVARAALELGTADESTLVTRVRALKDDLAALHVPIALGHEFDSQRAARTDLADHPERNRDLVRLEGEVLDSEEAEQIVRLGLPRLVQRGALRRRGGRFEPGAHAGLLAYYARSLACLPEAGGSREAGPVRNP